MGSRFSAAAVLSGAVLAIGIAQIVRAAASGAGVISWLVGVAFIIAGGGRLVLWFKGHR